MLDANRMGRKREQLAGWFDNRSVCFPTDFPSASTLWSAGIRRVVLIQKSGTRPAIDLAGMLEEWQKLGITFFLKLTDPPGPAVPFTVKRAFWLWRLFHGVERWFFERGLEGAFGKRIPLPPPQLSSGG